MGGSRPDRFGAIAGRFTVAEKTQSTEAETLKVVRAIHEGLGESWAYANYGGDELATAV